MMHILWGLLNICLLILFFKASYSATILLAGKIGRFSSFVLIFGFVSYSCQNKNVDIDQTHKKWENPEAKQLGEDVGKIEGVVVENGLIYDYRIDYVLKEDSTGAKKISRATFGGAGVSLFTQRKINDFVVQSASAEEPLQYFANVTEDWYILGLKVFTTYNSFKNS
jgi:hypothetical protein